MLNWHNLAIEETFKELESRPDGLVSGEVAERQKEFGQNLLPEENPLSALAIFLEQFKNPLIYILLAASLASLFFQNYQDSIAIFAVLLLNALIGFFQEYKASRILAQLKKAVRVKAYVLRDGREKEIDQQELVPGDIFLLWPGNKVPADARLIEARDLKINEASLTGEWQPAEKKTEVIPIATALGDRDNLVYGGCLVEEGYGRAVVVATGSSSEIGKIAQLVKGTKEEETPFQKKLAAFSRIVGAILVLICLGIFIQELVAEREFFEAFSVAVAVAVASVPEGLPAAVTAILALGAQRILNKGGLIRRLSSAETLGSTGVILTDKTGTLTEAEMKVTGIFPDGGKTRRLVLKIACLVVEAFVESPKTSSNDWIVRGRPTDRALLLSAVEDGLRKEELEEKEPRIKFLSFDPVSKHSASLHRVSPEENVLYVLGAAEKILALSEQFQVSDLPRPFNAGEKEALNGKIDELAKRGERVLAVAFRHCSAGGADLKDLINGLTFAGLISLGDPIRKDAGEAMNICRQAGIRPVIVTGDHKLTAVSVARQLGLPSEGKNILEGQDLDKLSDQDLQNRLEEIEIFARVEPSQKLRIVEQWQKKGEVVAMTGDGVNDAPALKKADIGIALGSGKDAAKEAADLVLVNDSFSTIVAAIGEGRAIIDNIRKVVTYLLSDSFTEVILISASLVLGLPLPVLASQILWVNLIEDGPLGLSLGFEPAEKDVMRRQPDNPKSSLLTGQMKALIFIIGLVTDLLLLGLFFWLVKTSTYEISHIRSIIFAGLAIDSVFYIFSCRSLNKNLWQINLFSNKFLIAAWALALTMLLAAIYFPPLQTILRLEPLNLFDWQLILGLGALNIALIELTKYIFIANRIRYIGLPSAIRKTKLQNSGMIK